MPGFATGSPVYAGFWSRLGALLVDGIVMFAIGLPFYVASIVFFRKAFEDCFTIDDEIYCPDGALDGGALAIAIVLASVGALLAAILIIRWQGQGASPGMKAAGNRLVDAHTLQPIGGGRATGRYFASILSSIPCYLGFLWMLWDGNRQTWHDKMTNSVVVKG